MAQSDEIRSLLNSKFQAKQDRIGAFPGQLGDGFGNVIVTGPVNHVWCRIAGMTVDVYNNRVPAENDLLVMVGTDPTQPELFQVLSTRTAVPGGTTGGAITGYASSSRYQWMAANGGQDPLFIDKRQYLPLRPGAGGGMLLQVYRDFIFTGTGWVAVNTQTVDLSTHIPTTTGKTALVLITIDNTGAVVTTKGAEVDITALVLTDLPAVPASTREVLGAVRVYNGQTAIYEARTNTDIVDLRYSGWSANEASSIANHDHSGDSGDGGQFFLTNLLSSGASAGQVPQANGSGGITWTDDGPALARFFMDGRLAAITGVGGAFVAPTYMTIDHVYIHAAAKGTAGSTIVDVNRNGTSVFTTAASRPTLAYNDADGVAKSGTPDIIYLDENDVLTVDIDQVATGAEGLTVEIVLAAGNDPTNMTYGRALMISEIWSNHGFPTDGADTVTTGVTSPLSTPPTNLASVDRLSIVMDNNAGTTVMTAQPWIFRPTVSNNKLAIVHQGHSSALDDVGIGDTIRALVDDGFTVAGFLMPDNGANHNGYPTPTGSLNYLKFFIEPVTRTINHLLPEGFTAVYMTGLSGGGWTTTVAAAVDARISKSVQVSGTLPLACTTSRDWEQYLPGLTITDYPPLYLMGADKPGREQVQILADNDVIFNLSDYNEGPDYASGTTSDAAALGGTWSLYWNHTRSGHSIAASDLAVIENAFGY